MTITANWHLDLLAKEIGHIGGQKEVHDVYFGVPVGLKQRAAVKEQVAMTSYKGTCHQSAENDTKQGK